jgi:hypothetical protein
MPTYTFLNKETNEEFTDMMSISAMEEFLKNNSHITQVIGAPAIADPTRLGMRKPDSGFRDLLKKVKSAHRGSTVNTW